MWTMACQASQNVDIGMSNVDHGMPMTCQASQNVDHGILAKCRPWHANDMSRLGKCRPWHANDMPSLAKCPSQPTLHVESEFVRRRRSFSVAVELFGRTCCLPRSWTLGWVDRSASGVHRSARPFCRRYAPGLNWPGRASGAVTLKKLECSKQAYALNTLAWDNIIGFRRTTAKAFAKDVFINQERKLGARRRSDTVLVSTINDADQGSADVTFRTPPAPYEKSKFLGSGGSMVARLKLKGIDGRAPPGVEPAA
ncbi:hypothetical protein DVH24_014702 [Malus domestica]|uniref:rRNA intron-encoded homing endonuclease n=1 Tax=Malus domestica TaxID=3750 RepID=A0A498KVI6_MALDO|nr:hypothetical protein DVH24_014702 [Malus domestica]